MLAPLTKRQREIFDYLTHHIRVRGFAPSLEEIKAHLQLSAIATVHKHLNNLQAKGWIKRRWNIPRAIELLSDDGCCPTCGQKVPAAVAVTDATTVGTGI